MYYLQRRRSLIYGLFLFISFILVKNVQAETTGDFFTKNFIGEYHYVYNSNGRYGDFEYITRNSDGHITYCIEPGVSFSKEVYTGYFNMSNEELSQLLHLTNEQILDITLVAQFGWGYNNHTGKEWIVATQALIWKTLGLDFSFTSRNSKSNPWQYVINTPAEIEEKMNEITNDIENYKKTPSFNTNYAKVSINHSYTFTDNSNSLDNYEILDCDNCNATISNNNQVIVNPVNNQSGTVHLAKKSANWPTNFFIYYKDDGQNLLVPGNVNKSVIDLNYEVVSGSLTIHKLDADTKTCTPKTLFGATLEGTTFTIYKEDKSVLTQVVVGSDCLANIDNLEVGRYFAMESRSGVNYQAEINKHWFTITENDLHQEITVYNKAYLGQVFLEKLDSKTKSCNITHTDATLNGAVYGIYYKQNNNLVDTITIDDSCQGSSKDNLPPGNYYLQEIKAPTGYKLDTKKYEFTISKNKNKNKIEEVHLSVYDDIYETNLVINKTYLTSNGVAAEVGAVFEIYLKSSMELVNTLTIDESATASTILNYGNYIIKQTKGKNGYKLSSDILLTVDENVNENTYITLLNKPRSLKLKVVKTDTQENKVKLKGIKFKIYDKINQKYICQTITYPTSKVVCEFETDENGEFITPYSLDPSTYNIEEVDQSISGYLWNKKPLEFTIDENTPFITNEHGEDIFVLEFSNKAVTGQIKIKKKGEQIKYKNNSFYYEEIPLSHIFFNLYDELGNLIGEYETDENGSINIKNLKLGKYILKEVRTLNNYVLDEKEYAFDLKYKDQYTATVTKTLTIKNYLKKGQLEFIKIDDKTNKPLANVEIEIYDAAQNELIYKGKTNKSGKIIINNLYIGKFYIIEKEPITGYVLNNSKVYFEVKENGQIVKVNMTNRKIKSKIHFQKTNDSGIPLQGVKVGLYDEKGKLLGTYYTNENGDIELELEYGNYYLQELETIEGYVLNDKKIEIQVKTDGEVINKELTNRKIKSKVHFHKINDSDIPLEGVKVGLYNEKGKLLETYFTDKKGNIELELEYGNYYLQELETIEGYVLNDKKIEIQVKTDGEVINKELTNRKIKSKVHFHKTNESDIPLQGIKVGLYNEKGKLLETYFTDKKGNIEFELEYGKYYLQELETIDGYVLNNKKIEIQVKTDGEIIEKVLTNRKIKSKVHFHKTNESDIPLQRVKVGLYNKKGKLLETYLTDENGDVDLELEYGSYYLQELETIEGYVLNDEKLEIQVKTDGEIINKELTNKKIKSKIILHKMDDNGVPLPNVTIGLYNSDDVLLNSYVTNTNGIIELELEYGSYYFKEIDTLDSYILSDEKIYYDVIDNDTIIEKNLINHKIKSKIHFQKTDENGCPLEGVKVGLYDKAGKLLETYLTDEQGNIELELEYGTYYLQELETIDGYILNEEKKYININKNDQDIFLNLINQKENIEIIQIPNTFKDNYNFLINIFITLLFILPIVYHGYIYKKA